MCLEANDKFSPLPSFPLRFFFYRTYNKRKFLKGTIWRARDEMKSVEKLKRLLPLFCFVLLFFLFSFLFWQSHGFFFFSEQEERNYENSKIQSFVFVRGRKKGQKWKGEERLFFFISVKCLLFFAFHSERENRELLTNFNAV